MNKYYKIGSAVALSALISLGVFVLSYNYFPISLFDEKGMFGATITTINAGDTLKDSRTVINDNFTNLNNSKLETSTFNTVTSMPTVTTLSALQTIGTVISGIWHGSIIDVLYGGTGTSPFATGTVLYGYGSGYLRSTATGTTGQALTWGASGTPVWTSIGVNQSDNYSWTGLHSFAATTTLATTTVKGVDLTIGTSSNNVVRLDSSAKLPAIDGSQLTGFTWKNGTFSKTISDASYAGTTTITHGLGRTPKVIEISCQPTGGTGVPNYNSEGTYNGSTYAAISNDGTTAEISTSYIVKYAGTMGSQQNAATVSTFSSTTVALSWVKTGSPTGTFNCIWSAF